MDLEKINHINNKINKQIKKYLHKQLIIVIYLNHLIGKSNYINIIYRKLAPPR